MTWFYLLAVILTTGGMPGSAPAYPFPSAEECNAAGLAFAAQVRADDKVKQAAWECVPVDFDRLDPVLEPKRAS